MRVLDRQRQVRIGGRGAIHPREQQAIDPWTRCLGDRPAIHCDAEPLDERFEIRPAGAVRPKVLHQHNRGPRTDSARFKDGGRRAMKELVAQLPNRSGLQTQGPAECVQTGRLSR